MISGKATWKKKIAAKAGRGKRRHNVVPERPLADAIDGLENNGENRSLQPKEKRLNRADIAEDRVDPAQRHDSDDAGQNE